MSARQDMFAQIETDLQGINGGGDYTVKVERVYPDELPASAIEEFPSPVIIRGPDELEQARGLHKFDAARDAGGAYRFRGADA